MILFGPASSYILTYATQQPEKQMKTESNIRRLNVAWAATTHKPTSDLLYSKTCSKWDEVESGETKREISERTRTISRWLIGRTRTVDTRSKTSQSNCEVCPTTHFTFPAHLNDTCCRLTLRLHVPVFFRNKQWIFFQFHIFPLVHGKSLLHISKVGRCASVFSSSFSIK